jgi:hypothetical protein
MTAHCTTETSAGLAFRTAHHRVRHLFCPRKGPVGRTAIGKAAGNRLRLSVNKDIPVRQPSADIVSQSTLVTSRNYFPGCLSKDRMPSWFQERLHTYSVTEQKVTGAAGENLIATLAASATRLLPCELSNTLTRPGTATAGATIPIRTIVSFRPHRTLVAQARRGLLRCTIQSGLCRLGAVWTTFFVLWCLPTVR